MDEAHHLTALQLAENGIRQLHARFLRSPYASARILSVDGSAALKIPGVVAVLTALVLESLSGDDIGAASALRRDRDEPAAVAAALGFVHTRGHAVNWPAFFSARDARRRQ